MDLTVVEDTIARPRTTCVLKALVYINITLPGMIGPLAYQVDMLEFSSNTVPRSKCVISE